MKKPLKLASSLTVVGVALSSGLDENVLAETPPSQPINPSSASALQPLKPAPAAVEPPLSTQPEQVALPPEQSRPAPVSLAPQPTSTPPPASNSAPPLQSSPAPQPVPTPPSAADSQSALPLRSEPLPVKPATVSAPTIVAPEKINPIITSTPVNDRVLSPRSDRTVSVEGEYQSEVKVFTPSAKATYRTNQQAVRQVTPDGLRSLDYKADYVLVDTPTTNRKITVERLRKIETLGQHAQFSLTGTCVGNPQADPVTDQCAYTPGLATDNSPEAVDPKTGNSSRIIQAEQGKGAAFDIVTPENLEAMKAPGFQQGLPKSDPRSQQVGADILTPNIAITDAKEVGEQRLEEKTNSPALSFVRVHRTLVANRDRAQLAQTVRGVSVLSDLDQGGIPSDNLVGLGVMGLAQLASEVRPSLKGTGEVPTGANENLFLAANSVHLPGNSFTAYHAGIGNAKNYAEPNRPITEQPATFNSVWIGLSPVIDRNSSPVERISNLTRQETLFTGGGEGGTNDLTVPDFSVLLRNPDGTAIKGSPKLLSNFYSQLYLEFFKSKGDQAIGTSLDEKTRFVPSIALTGSVATPKRTFQYFGGIIADPKDLGNSKAYLGASYSHRNPEQRFAWNIEGQGVVGTDPDYYSYVSASIAKGWQLGAKPGTASAFIGASALYSPDRPRQYNEIFFSPSNFVTLTSGINFGKKLPLQLTVDYTPEVLGDNGVKETLTANARVQFSDRFALSGFYTPIAKSDSRSTTGIKVESAFGKTADLKVYLGWVLNQYNLSTRTFNENQISFGVQKQIR